MRKRTRRSERSERSEAWTRDGAVVPLNIMLQMQERRSMAYTLYGAEYECLRVASAASATAGALGALGATEHELAKCAAVQKRHERIMAAAVETFDLLTWGRKTHLQAI